MALPVCALWIQYYGFTETGSENLSSGGDCIEICEKKVSQYENVIIKL